MEVEIEQHDLFSILSSSQYDKFLKVASLADAAEEPPIATPQYRRHSGQLESPALQQQNTNSFLGLDRDISHYVNSIIK